jgi:GNAT superfamily N-acetyltransferase
MEIIVRPWRKSDIESIRSITWQSWISAYTSFIPESDLRTHLDTTYAEASLLRMFDDPLMQGFVADADGTIAGYARLFVNQEENRLYVSSLYLLPDFQGKEIAGNIKQRICAEAR